jgi:HD domain-containing protein
MATRKDGIATQGERWSDVLKAAPEVWPVPREVAGVEWPDSKLVRDATDYVRELSAPIVFNHVLRTYVFGTLLGRAKNLKFDAELFYLGAVFHDLGQTERFMGRQRFEVDGADAAAEFLQNNGVPKESIEVVWDAVALHTSRGIVERKRPEIALVSAGAGADVIGFGIDQLPRRAIEQVIAAFPRPGFKKAYQKVMAEIVTRKPETAALNLLAQVGERHVAGYKAPNLCDLMNASAFED